MLNKSLEVPHENLRVGNLVPLPLIGLLYQPQMIDDDECGAVSGMIGRGNRSTLRKPSLVSPCPLQIPHDLTWALMNGLTNP
jgi:hypothetical protein